ncbi:MAG: glycosyltransferase [Actinobacteria bacterium]|nr:glycosyltransferase [Actinomycetota bacterium]
MHVLFAAAELAPLASVGGLSQAAAGLVDELRRQGVRVTVVVPDYDPSIGLGDEEGSAVAVPDWVGPTRRRRGVHPVCGPVDLLTVPGIDRPHPYLRADGTGWEDNDARFLRFGRAVAALAETVRPDVVHLNDWHTATALAALDPAQATVLTVHNLAYQGTTDVAWAAKIGPRGDAFVRDGTMNPLAGGIRLADAVVAVSPSYAGEILHPAHGAGLDDLLRARGDTLVGILNGIDTRRWDPATDTNLARRFDAGDPTGRAADRTDLLDQLGWDDAEDPVVVMVTRLVEQKGVDLALACVPFLAGMRMRLAVLGAGERHLAGALRDAAAERPDRVAFVEGYDDGLARRFLAGADLLLMPSRFEPCGLTQLQAMRYGAFPVVTAVGGLRDTVVDLDADPRHGNGWVAADADVPHLLDALWRARRGLTDRRRTTALRRRILRLDASWARPARAHIELYRQALRRRSA